MPTAEGGPVVPGADRVAMDTAVVRGVRGNPARVGDGVVVGPRARLTGRAVAEDASLGTATTASIDARVGGRAEMRIDRVVRLRTALPEGAVVPLGWVAVGDPARILPPEGHGEIWAVPQVMPRCVAFLRSTRAGDRPTG